MASLLVAGGIGSACQGPAPVDLGAAGTFAILAKSGITDVPVSHVTGDVGVSPITGATLALTCPEVVGKVYTDDAAGPLPCRVTNASLLTLAVQSSIWNMHTWMPPDEPLPLPLSWAPVRSAG